MFKRLTLALTLAISLVTIKPAMAFDDYLDGVTTLEEVLDYTLRYHISEPDVDKLVNGAIEGMLETLNDPYTEYMTEESLNDFTDSLNGEQYVGIGIRMELKNGYPQITEVFTDSPAFLSGLMEGDLIVAVAGESLQDQPLSKASDKILGEEGTDVTITIRRGEHEFDVTLTRAAVQVATVEIDDVTNGIGYIDVNSFGQNTPGEFITALQQMKGQKAEALIIDLRNNHGGYVMSAVRMVSQFLPSGKKVVSIVEKSGEESVYPSFGNPTVTDIPVVILMNEDSASASEIFAGALQDYGVAKLLGTQSFGKGKVQSVISMESGGALKITTGKYQLPGGRFIDGLGITPDIQVKSPGLQLVRAKELLQPVDETVVKLTIDQNTAIVNDESIRMLSTPYQKEGVVYLPLRFVMEALGYQVDWSAERNGIAMGAADNLLFVPASGGTLHPVEVTDGVSYISSADLAKLGLQCQTDGQSVTISED